MTAPASVIWPRDENSLFHPALVLIVAAAIVFSQKSYCVVHIIVIVMGFVKSLFLNQAEGNEIKYVTARV
jgi:hypothetical protein